MARDFALFTTYTLIVIITPNQLQLIPHLTCTIVTSNTTPIIYKGTQYTLIFYKFFALKEEVQAIEALLKHKYTYAREN